MNESTQQLLTTIAENEQRVYDAGIEKGKNARDAEWWNTYLTPIRTGKACNYLFAGPAWNGHTFYPTEDIVIKDNSENLFNRFNWQFHSPVIDLAQRLEECGVAVAIDLSQASNCSSTFYYAYISRIPKFICNGAKYTTLILVFSNAKYLVTIDEWVIRDDGTNIFDRTFTGATALKNIKITGVIGRTISFSDCPLTIASLKNIISCLKNYKDTENEGKYTITFSSNCWAALEESGPAPNGSTWQDYVTSTLGWSI